MPDKAFAEAPDSIVADGKFVFGRFINAPSRINMLDVEHPYHYSIPRIVKNWRLKEWIAFEMGNPRFFVFAVLYNVKSFSLAAFKVLDRETKKQFAFRRLLPGSALSFPECFDRIDVEWRSIGHRLAVHSDIEAGIIRLSVERRSRHVDRQIHASFEFAINARQTAVQSVCLPLGLNRAMYSTKALMPMTAVMNLGGERFELSGPEVMGVIDDHKGFYPYRMRFDWALAFGLDARDRRVGFNLTDNQVRDQEAYNENCLWINSRVFPLPPVKITMPQGSDYDWIIQDMEGRVDLVFKPESQQRWKVDMGFMKSDYDGPFGSFKGFVKTPDGERIEAERLYGMAERKRLQI